MTQATDFNATVRALREAERVLLVTHESPDGDALGSLVAMKLACEQLGKDVVAYLTPETGLPREYAFMDLAGVLRAPPEDCESRVLVALDCANARRIGPDQSPHERAASILNIDHHHDNSRFGDVNLVIADASSTAEILAEILAALEIDLTPSLAEALYIGVLTDTGRFQYGNTTPKTLRLAADLLESGADAHRIFQDLYESIELGKFRLLGRALENATVLDEGRLIVASLSREDFAKAGADEPLAEGIIDYLRAVAGTDMVALIREPPLDGSLPSRKASLRTTHSGIDVSAIARQFGGGGHRQAAGFSTDQDVDELIVALQAAYQGQLDEQAA
jgi:phosphoesterase RecJ-like protein